MSLRAEDLMVGDWVLLSATQVPICVKAVYSTMIVPTPDTDNFHAVIGDEFLAPIPLTPEILEKNGFVYDLEDKLFEDIYPRISMLYAQYRLVENYGINYGEMSEIKYVHQLQHALRLCGIDKEIIL